MNAIFFVLAKRTYERTNERLISGTQPIEDRENTQRQTDRQAQRQKKILPNYRTFSGNKLDVYTVHAGRDPVRRTSDGRLRQTTVEHVLQAVVPRRDVCADLRLPQELRDTAL